MRYCHCLVKLALSKLRREEMLVDIHKKTNQNKRDETHTNSRNCLHNRETESMNSYAASCRRQCEHKHQHTETRRCVMSNIIVYWLTEMKCPVIVCFAYKKKELNDFGVKNQTKYAKARRQWDRLHFQLCTPQNQTFFLYFPRNSDDRLLLMFSTRTDAKRQ